MSQNANSLLEKIRNHEAIVGVIGLGYVGLPIAVELAKKGFKVKGIDKQEEVIDALMRGKSHVPDVSGSDVSAVRLSDHLSLIRVEEAYMDTETEIREEVARCDVYLICVPTPLDYSSGCNPDLDLLDQATEIVLHSLVISNKRSGKERLVIVESTTYPGATEDVVWKKLSHYSKMVHLAYSPERTNPRGGRNFTEIAKIVGGHTSHSTRLASEFYSQLFAKTVPVDSMSAAETVKCAENSFRFVNIAFANRLAQLWTLPTMNLWTLVDSADYRSFTLAQVFPDVILNNTALTFDDFFPQVIAHNKLEQEFGNGPYGSINKLAQQCIRAVREIQNDNSAERPATEILLSAFRTLSVLFFYQLGRFCSAIPVQMDLRDILRAILTKPFGLDPGRPGPGVGGHCIPVDSLYLYWKARQARADLALIWEAAYINEEMTNEVVRLVSHCLHQNGKKVKGSKILTLGITYKENVPDIRESKAITILKYLLAGGATLFYCDPVFSEHRSDLYPDSHEWHKRELYLSVEHPPTRHTQEQKWKCYVNMVTFQDCIERITKDSIDCVTILADHDNFSPSFYEKICRRKTVAVVDTRNAIHTKLGTSDENVFVFGRPT